MGGFESKVYQFNSIQKLIKLIAQIVTQYKSVNKPKCNKTPSTI